MQAKNKGKTVDLVKRFESGQVAKTTSRTQRQNVTKLPNTLTKIDSKENENPKDNFSSKSSLFSMQTPPSLPAEKKNLLDKELSQESSLNSTVENARPIPAKRPTVIIVDSVTTTQPTPIPRKPSESKNINELLERKAFSDGLVTKLPVKKTYGDVSVTKLLEKKTYGDVLATKSPEKKTIGEGPVKKNTEKKTYGGVPVTKVNDNQKRVRENVFQLNKNSDETKHIVKENNLSLTANHVRQTTNHGHQTANYGRSQSTVITKNQNLDLGKKRLLTKQRTLSLTKVEEAEDDRHEGPSSKLIEEVLDDDEITNEILKNNNIDSFNKTDELEIENYSKKSLKRDPSIISVDPSTGSFNKFENCYLHRSQQSIFDTENEKHFEKNHKRALSPSNNCNIRTTYGSNEAKIHIKFDNYTNIELEDALQQFHKYLESNLSPKYSNSSPNKEIFEKQSRRNFTDSKSRFFTWNKKMGRSSTWNHQTRRRMLNLNSFEDLSPSCEKDTAHGNKEMLNPRLNRSYSSSVVERKDCSILHYNGSTSTINTDNSDIEFERSSLSRWKKMFRKYSSRDSLKEDKEFNEEIGKKGNKQRWLLKNLFSSNRNGIKK